jgi:hypothetical protein
MYLKIMGSEDMPDHDSSKPHSLYVAVEYNTHRDDQGDLFIRIRSVDDEFKQRVFSNIYVMNADGKTINTISPPSGAPN